MGEKRNIQSVTSLHLDPSLCSRAHSDRISRHNESSIRRRRRRRCPVIGSRRIDGRYLRNMAYILG